MKKVMILALVGLFFLAGCNESAETPKENASVPAVKPAVAAPAPVAKANVPQASFKSIDWEQAKKMVAEGAIYVDVRTEQELRDGYAPYAINIPANNIKERMSELPKDKDLLLYCRSGRRSEAAAHFLVKNGYDRVYNIVGGFLAYPREKK